MSGTTSNEPAGHPSFEHLEPRILLSAGDLDPTFGVGGLVTTDFAGSSDGAYSVAVDANGKIVAAGSLGGDFALARFNTNGSLDETFGDDIDGDGTPDGLVTTDFGSTTDYAYSVAIGGDGKIVVAGRSFQAGTGYDFALARYNSDGSLDWKVTTDFAEATGFDAAWGVAIQTDGKIVAAGYSVQSGIGPDFALARYNTDGSLDDTFGDDIDGDGTPDGTVTTDFAGSDHGRSVAIQADGKIVVAGRSYQGIPTGDDFALARYDIDGSLDATFGTAGKVITDFGGSDDALSVAIDGDGKIVVAGYSDQWWPTGWDFALARYETNGSLDDTFGDDIDSDGTPDGLVITDFANSSDVAYSVAIQADGKIVAAGRSSVLDVSTPDFALARYDSDGSLDATFGTAGKVTTDFGATTDGIGGVAIQADGNIVVAGYSYQSDTGYDFALARYLGASVNQPPVADAGGRYEITEGGPVLLQASASSDPDNDPLTFGWDLNDDGAFADAAGETPIVTWAELAALGVGDDGIYDLIVRVDDGNDGVAEASTTLTVLNAAPAASATGPTEWVPGAPLNLTLGATDPSPDDQAAGFAYWVDWGDGTAEAAAGPDGTQITHAYDIVGSGRGLELLSVAVDGGSGDGASYYSAISPDGRYVAFGSFASNLVPGDTPGSPDVFVCDRVTGQTERIDGATHPAISDDGRYVAYRSPWPPWEIFLYDRQTGQTMPVSVAPGGAAANGPSDFPSISADGRYVAFVSEASNLVPDDNNGADDVFVWDRLTEVITRVSLAADGSEANGYSGQATISADGRYVGFTSYADNLLPAGDANGQEGDVFLHDRDADEDGIYDEPGAVALELLSVASDATQGNADSMELSVSPDGRYVAFRSYASNLVAGDTNGTGDIFVRDRWTGQTELVTVALDGGPANSYSWLPDISPDGRYVAFASNASNLVEGDLAGQWDIFRHDRATGRTERVNVAPDGSEANDMSGLGDGAVISAAGHVVFSTLASNLAANDDNGTYDVFIANPSSFVVAVTATDKDGGESAPVYHEVGIVPATVAGDDVLVGGTGGDDDIGVGSGSVVVTINGVEVGHFEAVTGRIVVYGLGGDDTITVAPDITLASELYGGDGNDTLTGGGGDNILDGGDGDDILIGGPGTNIIIGGGGSNTFIDGGGQNTFETAPGSTTPEVFADAYETDEDNVLTVTAPQGVLANDLDPQGLPLTAVLVDDVTDGTLTLNGDGSFIYTPDADWYGTDSFTYLASNGTEDSSEATVAITVHNLLDPAQVIQEVAGELGDLANDPEITPKAAAAVTDALEELVGKNGGKSASGALDKIEAGNANAAFVKMIKAIRDLEDAEAADPALDLTALKGAIAGAAKSLAADAVTQAEAAAGTPQDHANVADAQAFLADGQDLLDQSNFVSAVQKFQKAFQKADAVIN